MSRLVLLLRAAVMLFIYMTFLCTSFACCRSLDAQSMEIARLHHPLDGAHICSDNADDAAGYLRIYRGLKAATIEISIDYVVAAVFRQDRIPPESHGESSAAETPLHVFPLLPQNFILEVLGNHTLRVAVFDKLGNDLQPEIVSEFHISECAQPFDVESAKQSLAIAHVSQSG